ncbi:hypothetical protein GGF32_004223 [Allomyces javanicus]|nr:hypothetical protein GGF32_004223 [Allomyces javanicus]
MRSQDDPALLKFLLTKRPANPSRQFDGIYVRAYCVGSAAIMDQVLSCIHQFDSPDTALRDILECTMSQAVMGVANEDELAARILPLPRIVQNCPSPALLRKMLFRDGVDPTASNNFVLRLTRAYGLSRFVDILLEDPRVAALDQSMPAVEQSGPHFLDNVGPDVVS